MANRYFSGPTLQPAKMDLAGPLLQGLALAQRQKEMEENKRQFEIGQMAAAEAAKAKAEHDQMKFDLEVAKFNADLPLKDAQLKESVLRGEKLTAEQEEVRRQRQITKQKQFLSATTPLTQLARNFNKAQSPLAKSALSEEFSKRYAEIRSGLVESGTAPDLPEEIGIDQWTGMADEIGSNLAGSMNQDDFDRSAAARIVAADLSREGITAPIDEQILNSLHPDRMRAAMELIQSQKERTAEKSAARINTVAPTGKMESTLQESLRQNDQAQFLINKILTGKYGDELFGPASAKADTVLNVADSIAGLFGYKMPGRVDQFLRDRQDLASFSKILVSDLLRKASGLAMTESEREFLLGAFGDMDKMGPTKFNEAVGKLKEILQREENRDWRLLTSGFTDPSKRKEDAPATIKDPVTGRDMSEMSDEELQGILSE